MKSVFVHKAHSCGSTMSEFAIEYERTEEGWIVFPRDIEYRRKFFPDTVFEHPAKANCFLIEALVDYLTKPGDVILDPFGGTGTLMLAALTERVVRLIDVEPHYIQLMQEGAKLIGGDIEVYQGDCRQILPITCDAIITSPPYAGLLGAKESQAYSEKSREKVRLYGGQDASSLNLARLNAFYFSQAMKKVYQGMYASLPQDGPLAIITQDFMQGGKRYLLSADIIRHAIANGFTFAEWFKRLMGQSHRRDIQRSKGRDVVEDEDTLIFRRT